VSNLSYVHLVQSLRFATMISLSSFLFVQGFEMSPLQLLALEEIMSFATNHYAIACN